jgi:hypothetical protein
VSRDRDPAGRPRNARPRDGLGRPLPRGQAGQPVLPDDLALTGADAARLADELLRAGQPFQAHEALEAAWKSARPAERDLWQGLAQVAVGLTHARRGNARGAVALLRRGASRVRAYQDQAGQDQAGQDRTGGTARPYGIDVAAVAAAAGDLAARIEQQGLAGLREQDCWAG